MALSDECYADPASLEKDAEGNPIDWPLNLDSHGFRLPTDAEFEVTDRGGTTSMYSFGDDVRELARYAWFQENAVGQRASPAARLRPNPRGLFDMHGNLGEWCHDQAREGTTNSIGPISGRSSANRIVRGGTWITDAAMCRSARRVFWPANFGDSYIGFRIAITLPPGKRVVSQPSSGADSAR
jgi:formylglycine-generating enzyme required for sulfatase activity